MHYRLTGMVVIVLFLVAGQAIRAEEPLFGRHVTPLLFKLGCSAGQCHGAFAGKGGCRLPALRRGITSSFQGSIFSACFGSMASSASRAACRMAGSS